MIPDPRIGSHLESRLIGRIQLYKAVNRIFDVYAHYYHIITVNMCQLVGSKFCPSRTRNGTRRLEIDGRHFQDGARRGARWQPIV